MKNETIIASWDKILPDETADERMRSKIMEYQRSHQRKDLVITMTKTMKKLIPIAACFILVIAVTAFIGIQNNWFGTKEYMVTLDNGDTLIFGKDNPIGEASYAYDYEVKDRQLTAGELQALFPALSYNTENGNPYATFKADTGEMLRLELTIDDVHIHLAKAGLPATDTVIAGENRTADINGIPVKTGYFVTDANSKGIRTAIFFAEFEMNDTIIYLELAGNEQDSEQLSEKLSNTVYSMIISKAPDISSIKYE